MPRVKSKTFTDKELEIMRVLWACGEGSVRDIQQRVPPGAHYNSVLTIIRVLESKGHVNHREQGRGYVYRPTVSQQEARRRVLDYLIDGLFGGSATSVVLNLVETGDISMKELDQIRQRISQRKPPGGVSE